MLKPLIWALFLFLFTLVTAIPVNAQNNPLTPPDTSSPRATLRTFLTETTSGITIYQKNQNVRSLEGRNHLIRASRCLDLRHLPTSIALRYGIEHTVLLREIINRVYTPDYDSIPGFDEITESKLKSWTIPNTELHIVRLEDNDGIIRYVFSKNTIEKTDTYYKQIKHLPYLPNTEPHFNHDKYTQLGFLPKWSLSKFFGFKIWQWIGVSLFIIIGIAAVISLSLLSKRLLDFVDEKKQWELSYYIVGTITPLASFLCLMVWHQSLMWLRITGPILHESAKILKGLAIFALIWLIWATVNRVTTIIISVANLRPQGMDAQLIKLSSKTLMIIVAAILLIIGGNRLGIPTYSIITGLGISGLAVALAAQDTLANFLGSLMIMFDKPFRVGHWVCIGQHEGTVEDIGFRSTRIRTFYDSLISIPNSELVNTPIDNMGRTYFSSLQNIYQYYL